MNKNQFKQWLHLFTSLRPIELIGVTKLLKVKLCTDDVDEKNRPIARDGEDILFDCLEAINKLSNSERKQLLITIKRAGGRK